MIDYNWVEAKFDNMLQNINLMMWWKYCMEGVRPYNVLFGIVLNIEFCNVYKRGHHWSLTFLPLLDWLANELKISF